MSVVDLWEAPAHSDQLAEVIERLERIERMLGAGSVRTVTETQRRTRQAVAQAIEDGCHTRRTIAEHVRIAMQRVSDALLVLEAEGRVTKELRPTGGGRGGRCTGTSWFTPSPWNVFRQRPG